MSVDFEITLHRAKESGRCIVGPFVGEFGHMLVHVLPFLNYLHSQDINVTFFGFEEHKAFCVNDLGEPTVVDYIGIPDYFKSGVPDYNKLELVTDSHIKQLALDFVISSSKSGVPFYDISNHAIYYNQWWPWWFGKGYGKYYPIKKVFNPEGIVENAIALYTRKKPGAAAGPDWDFDLLLKAITPFVDTVYVVGHPEQSISLKGDKVLNVITKSNAKILTAVSKCKLVISPNSGSAYVARILRMPEIIYHNGPDAKYSWTNHCSERWSNSPMVRATNYDELESLTQRMMMT